jgi:hypothetical protein
LLACGGLLLLLLPSGEKVGMRGFMVGLVARLLACGGLSDACRRPSYFSLLAQREVAKRNGLIEPADPTSLGGRGVWEQAWLLLFDLQPHRAVAVN